MTADSGPAPTSARPGHSRHAALVFAGILLSRVVGLVRERVFGFYFGVTDEADAFRAAFRIPNLLQNLFGEGVLSASFIPVYASLIADDDHEEATRVAGAVFCRRGETFYSAGGEDRNYSRSARTVIGSVQRGQAMQRNSE